MTMMMMERNALSLLFERENMEREKDDDDDEEKG